MNKKIKRLNRRKAIRARCVDCSGGSYREVTDCEFSDCALFPYRSGQGKQNAGARAKDIRKYCLWCMVDQIGEVWNCHLVDCPLWPYRKTKTERPTEIKSFPKTGHIEVNGEAKILTECI